MTAISQFKSDTNRNESRVSAPERRHSPSRPWAKQAAQALFGKIETGGASMKSKGIFVVAMSLLLLYVPVAPIAASAAAGKMTTIGSADINGVAAPETTSVFPGDRISTQKGTTTSLNFAGGDAVVIPELTKASLGEQDGHFVISLDDGTVSVLNKTNAPITIDAHGARIVAANLPALFDVTLHGNELRVTARGGVARVETSNRTGEIQPGNTLDATLAPNSPAPQPGAAPSPSMAMGGVSAITWLVVGTAVVATTALVVGVIDLQKLGNCTVSPASNKVTCP
jgi:hypothetical protein